MMDKIKFGAIIILVLGSIFLSYILPPAMAIEVSHEYGPIEWSFQGKPVPETQWSPWLPPAQVGFRAKLGFLISDGTITIKTPIKLTFRYDPDAARSGEDFLIGVKAEPAAASYNTFQSAFGISLPNKMQVGFAGVSGVPIDLPWFDLPMDFWELVAKIPKVGDSIASAVSNIGVNTSTQGALPIGKTDSYHNERDLISFTLTEKTVKDMAPGVLGKIPESVRTNAVRLIKLANACSDSTALDKLQNYVEKALSVLYDAPTLTLKADPYFKLEGVRLRVNVRVFIPGGKGSGLYTLYFDKINQFQTVNFRDITPFISPGDNLTISVEDIAYEFRLIQGLTASVQISVLPLNLDNVEKTVTYTSAVLNASSDPFKVEVPIQQSTSIIQSLRANPGCTSVSVNWASPSVPLKGTVKAYDGNTPVATVIESTFKTAHNVIVPNLQQGKAYRFTVDCINQSQEPIPTKEVSATTFGGTCPERLERLTCNTLTLSNPNAVAGPDYVDFSWNTDQLASTEVMFSPSPDLSLNYVMAVKKVGDVVTQGWVTREGLRQFETNHGLRLSGLEPNTKYYYNLRSWTFINNDETNNPQDAVGYVGNITTLQGVPPPTVKVRVRSPAEGNISIVDMPVILTKNADIDFNLSVSTGSAGLSNDIILDRSTTYTFQAIGNACYQSASTELTVSSTAQGPLPEVVINIDKVPARNGYVFDSPNHGIAGATVSGKNSQGAPISATTNAGGGWVINSGLNPGSHTFIVSKDGYRNATVGITVNSCGRFIGLPVTLVARTYALNIVAKNQTGQAVKNAAVLIKEGDATIAQLTTDTQGKATKSGTLNDDNEHTFTITVTPAASATVNILPGQDFVSITSASTRNVTVICPADKKGPVPSQINLTQTGPRSFQATFKLDDEIGKSCVEYQDPQGQIKTTTWKAGIYSPGSGVSDHMVTVQSSSINPGTYRIKIKTKDKWNNIGESEVRELQITGTATTGTGTQTQQGGQGSTGAATQQGQGSGGPEKTLLKLTGKPAKAYLNKEFSVKVISQTQKALKVPATCVIDWGDGKKDQVDSEAPVKHTYLAAGKFNVSVTANLKSGDNFVAPLALATEITVAANSPKLTLVKGALPAVAMSYKFTIKAEEGSYPIGRWTLAFGDGKSETGEGKVTSASFNHTYAGPGTYKVELSVTDSSGVVTKKSLNLTIVPPKN